MATVLEESFDYGVGQLSNAWNINTTIPGQVTLTGSAAMMEWATGPSAGHGYGTYTVHALFVGTEPGPAIVFWPGDNNWPGQEIDMGELAVDGSGRQYGIVHWNAGGQDAFEYQIYNGVQTGVWHDYTMVWEPGRITFKVDGVEQGSITDHVPADFEHGGMNDTIGFINNNPNTSLTVSDVTYTPLGASTPSSAPAAPAAQDTSSTPAPASNSAGSGSDTLVLKISQDAWNGDATYTVSVDGTQVGGSYTASALHSSGQNDTLTLNGSWGGASHQVVVDFLNDAYGGTPSTDRNLHIDAMTYNGQEVPNAAADLYSAGSVAISLPGTANSTEAFSSVDWNALAAQAEANFLATGHWFM